MRFFINFSYKGTNYHGWQFQSNVITVQEEMEVAMSTLLKEPIKLTASSRTDSGVHASEQSAHFKTKNNINNIGIFLNAVNFFLKKHPVSILNIHKRSNNFHARHSAKERVYKYFIINRTSSLAIDKNKAWHIKKKLDVKLMKKGATILKGTHNFTTFRASNCQAKSPIRTLKKPLIIKSKNKIIFTFQSKSFLQQQVRSMVGSLKYLGEGKWNLKDFKKAFKSKKRSMCAPPAPAHGLYLVKVKY